MAHLCWDCTEVRKLVPKVSVPDTVSTRAHACVDANQPNKSRECFFLNNDNSETNPLGCVEAYMAYIIIMIIW